MARPNAHGAVPGPWGKVREQTLNPLNKCRYVETSIVAVGLFSDHAKVGHPFRPSLPFVFAQARGALFLLCSGSCKSQAVPVGQFAMEAPSV